MGRNQTDLLLLLSALLLGSMCYTKKLKVQLKDLSINYKKARLENQRMIDVAQSKLINQANNLEEATFYDELQAGLSKLALMNSSSTFALSDKGKLRKLIAELQQLTPFSKLRSSEYYNVEEFRIQAIKVGTEFFHSKIKSPVSEFSVLVESMEEDKGKLKFKITPFNKFNIEAQYLSAINRKNSQSTKLNDLTYCDDLENSSFVIETKEGIQLSISSSYYANARP